MTEPRNAHEELLARGSYRLTAAAEKAERLELKLDDLLGASKAALVMIEFHDLGDCEVAKDLRATIARTEAAP